MRNISLTVNGRSLERAVEPRTHLADFLREELNLTGTHIGCEHGVCGACTLLVDGQPVRSCITYAVMCDGAAVTTIEGLEEDEVAEELRSAFKREHALQCGYCTPGMLIAARDIVTRFADPSEQAVRVELSGNLCRCTGYVGIVRAIQQVIAARSQRGVTAVSNGGRTERGPVGSRAIEASAQQAPLRAAASSKAEADGEAPLPFDRNAAWRPQATFRQSIIVQHPLDQVWAFFGKIEEVAACIPGVELTSEMKGDQVEGRMRLKVGPIATSFRGMAVIERDEATYSGRVFGSGLDSNAKSSARGQVSYALRAENESAARIEIEIGYYLTGILAQVGRSEIVKEVAARLTAAFAQNVSARLSGAPTAAGSSELSWGAMLASILMSRLRSAAGRILHRKRSEQT